MNRQSSTVIFPNYRPESGLGTPDEIAALVQRCVDRGLAKRSVPLAAPSQDSCLHDWLEDRPAVCRHCGKVRKLNCQGRFVCHKFNLQSVCRRCGTKRPNLNCGGKFSKHQYDFTGVCRRCGAMKPTGGGKAVNSNGASALPPAEAGAVPVAPGTERKLHCYRLKIDHQWGPFGRCKNCGRKKPKAANPNPLPK